MHFWPPDGTPPLRPCRELGAAGARQLTGSKRPRGSTLRAAVPPLGCDHREWWRRPWQTQRWELGSGAVGSFPPHPCSSGVWKSPLSSFHILLPSRDPAPCCCRYLWACLSDLQGALSYLRSSEGRVTLDSSVDSMEPNKIPICQKEKKKKRERNTQAQPQPQPGAKRDLEQNDEVRGCCAQCGKGSRTDAAAQHGEMHGIRVGAVSRPALSSALLQPPARATRAPGAAELSSKSTDREKAKGLFKTQGFGALHCSRANPSPGGSSAQASPEGHGQGQGRCSVMGLVRPANVSLHPPAVSPGLQVRCSSAGTGWDVSMQEGILYQGEGVVPPPHHCPVPPVMTCS